MTEAPCIDQLLANPGQHGLLSESIEFAREYGDKLNLKVKRLENEFGSDCHIAALSHHTSIEAISSPAVFTPAFSRSATRVKPRF